MISEVYNMDCLAAMREMPDNAFDLAVVDPPYGDGRSQSIHVERERGRERAEGDQLITASDSDLTVTNTTTHYVNRGGVARPQQVSHGDATARERTSDSRTGRGVSRVGGGWASKLDPTKKSLRGT